MSMSPHWSNGSASCLQTGSVTGTAPARAPACRLHWRPSRMKAALLLLIGALSVVALAASDLPAAVAWPGAFAAISHALRLAWRGLHAPRASVVLDAEAGTATVDGVAVGDVRLQWRGSLAWLRFRDATGRDRVLDWWPDTLPARARRELRLAAPVEQASPKATSMAT